MATNYPGALDDTTTMPTATDNVTDVVAAHHNNQSEAIIAVETKIGTGADTPVIGDVLYGTGTGTSSWGKPFFMQTIAADDTTTSTSYEDFASLTMSIVITQASSVYLCFTCGNITHDGGSLGTAYAAIHWGSTPAEEASTITWVSFDKQEGCDGGALASSILKTSVAAGTYTAKVQIKCGGTNTYTYTNGVLTAIVMPS